MLWPPDDRRPTRSPTRGFLALQLIDGFATTREHLVQRWRTVWGSLELIVAARRPGRASSTMTSKRDRAAAQAQTRTAPDARLAVLADAHTFLFADLAGFTAMTEAHGDEPAADLAEEFCQLVRELLPTFGAHEVKLIGDAIMLRVPDRTNAVRLGLAIVCDVGLRHGSPAVRVGMHSGSAVERSGDWYGSTVNIAARVAGLAGGGEVLLTDATHDTAELLTEVEFVSRGAHQLKNVSEPIVIYAAESRDPSAKRDWPIDPVCRMAVDPALRAGVLTHDGNEYTFCSMRCIATFSQEPGRYTTGSAPRS